MNVRHSNGSRSTGRPEVLVNEPYITRVIKVEMPQIKRNKDLNTNIVEHHFSVEEAVKYGVEGAVILHNLRFWIDKNMANRSNFHEGYCWTYNSARAFSEIFPYWNPKKIQRLMVFLEEQGAIKSSVLNKKVYDRTKWYTVIGFGELNKEYMDSALDNNVQVLDGSVQPIPYNNTYKKPDISDTSLEYLINIPEEEIKYLSKVYRATATEVVKKGEALYNWSLAKGKKQRMYRPFLKGALERDYGKREIKRNNPAQL